MKRKIFISINIASKDKKRLARTIEKWKDLPFKWVPESNFHITLVFLGHVLEEDLPQICEKTALAAQKSQFFDLEFEKIELFPSEKEPRMIALVGEANDGLLKLVNDSEEALGVSKAPKRSFRPHITLARARKYKWKELEEKPDILEDFRLSIEVFSIDIMASDFKEEGSEYAVIETCPLG